MSWDSRLSRTNRLLQISSVVDNMYVCMYVCYVCVCACVYIGIFFMYIFTPTHTHNHIFSLLFS
jgi:hypothetical protein